MSDELFKGFQPQAIGGPTVTPFTGEVIPPAELPNKPPKPPRKPRAAKPAADPAKDARSTRKPARKPKAERKPTTVRIKPKPAPATSTPAAPQYSLQTIFAVMRGLDEKDYPVFEQLLGNTAMRDRVLLALSKLFP